MWSLGRLRMKIQEVSKDFTISKTTYVEANTEKRGRNRRFGPREAEPCTPRMIPCSWSMEQSGTCA